MADGHVRATVMAWPHAMACHVTVVINTGCYCRRAVQHIDTPMVGVIAVIGAIGIAPRYATPPATALVNGVMTRIYWRY